MKRKRNNGVYNFLVASGVLATGSEIDIERAKQQYWQQVRKSYKRKRYQTQKSYTVFFTNDEAKRILQYAKETDLAVTEIIKESTLYYIDDKVAKNKRFIGEIRQILVGSYFILKIIGEQAKLPKQIIDTICDEVERVQILILKKMGHKN